MMHYLALATDFDGTIAHDGVVDEPTIAALERLKSGGRRAILVTGRELDDLRRVFPRLDLFDLVVAENGAVLYQPASREERALAASPDPGFIARLRALGVDPLSVGRSIVATWQPNQGKVLQAIQELGLELSITFNKGAVMALPAGINKASGLAAALDALDLAALNCVAVGDAENDMAFLDIAGLSVAVANATEALKERVAWITPSERGAGVRELVDRLLATDLSDLDARVPRQRVALARDDCGDPVEFAPHREALLLVGVSGGGKSTLTQGLTERLAGAGFQFCLIDPEGDYEGLDHAVGVGAADHAPAVERVAELLSKSGTNVAVNLLGVQLADRPALFGTLLPRLLALRNECGRPHMIIVDEAHHLLPADWNPGAGVIGEKPEGFLFITTRPESVCAWLPPRVDRLLVVGAEPRQAIERFCAARDLPAPDTPGEALPLGGMLALDAASGALSRLDVIPGAGPRLRHRRKYAEGMLGEDKSFWFRGPDGRLNLRAHNLMLFLQMAEGVDEGTWEYHRRQGDYSRWIAGSVKDESLAKAIGAVERGDLPSPAARDAIRREIETRYTAPG